MQSGVGQQTRATVQIGPMGINMSDSQFKPHGARLLVRKVDWNQRRTQSGLHIPETGLEDQTVGEVLELGPLATRAKVGDHVFFTERDAQELPNGLHIVACQNVLGTVEVTL